MDTPSMYSMSKLKKNIKHWDLRQFKMDALESYIETNKALAKGDLSALRSLTTPAIFSDMKKQIKQREKSGWESIDWDLVKKPDLYDVELVHVRVLAADQKDDESAFVQLTVRIGQTWFLIVLLLHPRRTPRPFLVRPRYRLRQ